MICLILAAGYATRLYPLTENFPKSLLKIKGKTILDWLVDDIAEAGIVKEYVVISNAKYYEHFIEWKKTKSLPITVLNDGTTSNENRLGAVKDIQFAVETLRLDDDLLVIAGDNVLDFSLQKLIGYFQEKQAACVMRYFEPSSEKLKKCGVVETDQNDLIIHMEEKPAKPKSNWAVPPFYAYPKRDVKLIKKGIEEGCGTDAPGSFVAWLCKQTKVYALEMTGRRYDIGDLESYQKAQEAYGGIQ